MDTLQDRDFYLQKALEAEQRAALTADAKTCKGLLFLAWEYRYLAAHLGPYRSALLRQTQRRSQPARDAVQAAADRVIPERETSPVSSEGQGGTLGQPRSF